MRILILVAAFLFMGMVGAKAANDVAVCHVEGNGTYHLLFVAAAAAYNGHYGVQHEGGLDVIPPFEFQGNTYSQRWDAEGQAIFAECDDDDPTNTPTPTPTNTPTDTPTSTSTESPTQTPTQTPTESPIDTPTETPSQVPSETIVVTSTVTEVPTSTTTEVSTPVDNFTPIINESPTVASTPTNQVPRGITNLPDSGVGQNEDIDYTNLLIGLLSFAVICGIVGLTIRHIRN